MNYKEIPTKSTISKLYEFSEANKKGERIMFEITRCNTNLPKLWYKSGKTKKLLKTYWGVQTWVYLPNGDCIGGYNPQIIPNTSQINFDFILDATEENKEILINEIAKRAFSE